MIIKLFRDAPAPITCYYCKGEMFVTVNQTIETSKKHSIIALGCYECAKKRTEIADRPGLGRSYIEAKYQVALYKSELIAYYKEREQDWAGWDTEGKDPPEINLEDLDWGDEEDDDSPEPPKNINVDDLDWGD